MRIGYRLALVAALLLADVAGAGSRGRRLVATVDDGKGGGTLATIELRPPWAARLAVAPTGADAVVRAFGPNAYTASRSDGTFRVIDVRRGIVLHELALGPTSAPQDVAIVNRRRVYVTRRDATHLLRVDPTTGDATEVVDLGPLAGPDGVPDMAMMAIHRQRLFVQLQRLSAEGPGPFDPPPLLAVVDLRREQLVDVDPVRPGVQGIELTGTPPKFKMQVLASPKRLALSASGGFFDAGGIELIDLDTLRSLGLIVREAEGQSGADVGAFVLLTPESGYLTFSTDLLLSSHLERFSAGGGVVGPELHVTLNYFVPTIVHDRRTRRLFVPDGGSSDGVFAFDATTGAKLTPKAIATGGPVRDVALVPPQ